MQVQPGLEYAAQVEGSEDDQMEDLKPDLKEMRREIDTLMERL